MLDDDHVLVPDHGNRRLYKLNVHTKSKTLVVDKFGDKRFNSPNDAVLDSEDGAIYFTDPPYGLKDQDKNPAKELDFNGVYTLRPDGSVALITDNLTRPNGVILSPDEQTLYVANSDPEAALWMAYERTDEAGFTEENGRILLDVTADVKAGLPGLPDGMAMGEDGTIFATGPGGVLMISPEGERLGCSDSESKADVASSKSKIGASRNMARAMASLWRWPPDKVAPCSPKSVSYPLGSAEINSWAKAAFAADSISFCEAPVLP